MSKVPTVFRIILGLAFVVFGLNFFLKFIPQPTPPKPVIDLMVPLMTVKWMDVVKVIEVVAGALLLANFFVPLALALLAPILIAILVFHATLEPSGLPLPLALIALEIALAYFYRDAFKPMLQAKTRPHAPAATAVPADRGTVRA